jgi:hypothetical protein
MSPTAAVVLTGSAAAVEPDGPLVRALFGRVEKLGDIAGHALWVELEGGAAEKNVVPTERTADGMERLVQRVARGFGLAAGPQEGQEPVPAGGGPRDRYAAAVLVQDQPAQLAQSQHDGGKRTRRGGKGYWSIGVMPSAARDLRP